MTDIVAVGLAEIGAENSGRTALYRLYGESGTLLYVGITGNPERRWAEHAADKSWWSFVTRRTVEWYESRQAAMAAEEAAIIIGRPMNNVEHNPMAPAVVSVELPGEWIIGLDMLRRSFVPGRPYCSRSMALAGLLYRELAARGLHGDPHCFHATCSTWPDGAVIPQPCGQCFCKEPGEETAA